MFNPCGSAKLAAIVITQHIANRRVSPEKSAFLCARCILIGDRRFQECPTAGFLSHSSTGGLGVNLHLAKKTVPQNARTSGSSPEDKMAHTLESHTLLQLCTVSGAPPCPTPLLSHPPPSGTSSRLACPPHIVISFGKAQNHQCCLSHTHTDTSAKVCKGVYVTLAMQVHPSA